jgi:hypothetical protein
LEECQRSGFRRSVSFTAKAQAYNAPLSDLFWINIRRVLSFEDAPAEAGSWGATIVSLLVD